MAGTWSAGANLATARSHIGGGGTSTDAITMGGYSGGRLGTCEVWNGTVWSSGGNLGTSRYSASGGGTSENAILACGYRTTGIATSEKYNGTAWSSGGNLYTGYALGAGGNSSNAIAMGGVTTTNYLTTCYKYNGSSWSSTGSLGTGRRYVSGDGNGSAAVIAAGATSGGKVVTAEFYNGSSWSSAPSISIARDANCTGGDSSRAFIAGGYSTANTTSTEELADGTAWATGGELSVARNMLCGGGTSAGICAGGTTGAVSNVTELYTWTIGEEEVVRIASSNRIASSSRHQRFYPILSNLQVLTTPTYDGSGQAVHPSTIYIPGGFAGYIYWMGMTPYPNGNDDYENPSLLASNDGITWVVPSGITNPLAPAPSQHNSDTSLIFNVDDGALYLYYNETTAVATTYRFKITEDPLTVDPKVTCSFPVEPMSEQVIYNGPGDWECYYINYAQKTICRVTSSDGITWGNETTIGTYDMDTGGAFDDPVLWHLSCTEVDGKLLFWITCYPKGSNSAYTDLFWGIREDEHSKILMKRPAILTEFSPWCTREVYMSKMTILENGQYRLYISGATTGGVWRIGCADVVLW